MIRAFPTARIAPPFENVQKRTGRQFIDEKRISDDRRKKGVNRKEGISN